jgi:magnesium-protoporphyrin O-methyltransferase
MHTTSYLRRRDQLTTYFDQTAAAAWRALTSSESVSRIRATVRAGRDDMRATLLDWLPRDLTGQTLLDAGSGTGALAIDAARRGARVVAIDVAANLVDVARRRAEREGVADAIDFRVGDMLLDAPDAVDHVVAMDSLIHYTPPDVLEVVAQLAGRARQSVLFTSAPWTPALGVMHFVGRLIPHRHHRAPAIEPVRTREMMEDIDATLGHRGWRATRTHRVTSGFYISQAIAVSRTCAD